MAVPDPETVRGQKRYGREEFVQELLACLVVGGPAPRWNTPAVPTVRGLRLLTGVAAQALGGDASSERAVPEFFNEFELPRRHDGEASGWPDFALRWPDRLILIELKTEAASHRRGQLAHYSDLAAHHYPTCRRELIYLTPPLPPTTVHDPVVCGHVTWDAVIPLLDSIWAVGPDDETRMAQYVAAYLRDLDRPVLGGAPPTPPYETAATVTPTGPVTAPAAGLDERLLAIAAEVAVDHRQRAADVDWEDGQAMENARLRLRDALHLRADGTGEVRPWIWRAASSDGGPLTPGGVALGYELRFSWYGRRT